MQRALAGDRDLLLAGDPVAPGELIAAPSADRLDRIAVCLLDCDAASQTERLAAAANPRCCSRATSRSRTGCASTSTIQGICPR